MQLRRRDALCVAIVFALSVSAQASAQQNDQQRSTLDRVEVTGTRIKKAAVEGQVPVQVLGREDIERSGLTSVGDIIQQITGSASSFNTKRNASGNDGFPSDGGGVGAGASTVDLRGLGSKRVLVLVDGQRWVNESSASGVGAAVDLNTIPMAIIERIEVLQDGASSLYGSDAIAGVVNIITRRTFDGVQISANYGQYKPGDGKAKGLDLAWGKSGDFGSVFLGGSFFDQGLVSSADRERSQFPVYGTGLALGSSRVPGGRFRFADGSGKTYDLTTNAGLNNPTYTPGLPDCSSGVARTDGFHCFKAANDAFNYQPFNLILSPSRRYGLFGQSRIKLGERMNWYARALVNRRESLNRAAPEPIDLGPGAGTTWASNVVIPANNPNNPFGITLDSSNILTIRRRPMEGGPRLFEQKVDTAYIGTGLEGDLELGGKSWLWDVNLSYGRNKAVQENRGSYNSKRIAEALNPAVCATVQGCVLLDIFGFNTMTPEMLKWVSPVFVDRSQQSLLQGSANVSGDLFNMPAGPLSFAAGYEYRRYQGSYQPDAATVRGEYNGVPSLPTTGGYHVQELFAEFNVPLARNNGFGKALDLSIAGRYSDYSTFGGQFTPKFGLRWQVADELLLRTTFAKGFRAPSIGELYGAPSRFDAGITDPCLAHGANPATGNAANCAAMGVPPNTQQFDPQIGVETGGNRALKPEKSTSFSMGAVWSPTLLADTQWSKSVDFEVTYYQHEVEGAIQALDPQTQLNLCVSTRDPKYCGGIVRTKQTGQIESFANYLLNLSSIRTSGWDANMYWTFPETGAGKFKWTWMNTFVGDYRAIGADGTLQALRPGRLVSDPVTRALPEWTSTSVLDWSRGHWNAAWTIRYISELIEECGDASGFGVCGNKPNKDENKLPATAFHDVQLGYQFMDKGPRFTVGVNNLFNQDPPICVSCNLNSFDGSTYDLPGGGFWYVRMDWKF